MLVMSPDALMKTDIADHALEKLRQSRIREVILLGRRGAAQVAFTNPEIDDGHYLAIAATNTPEQARLILIDPKQGVDYFNFISLPHLDGGEIIDQKEVAMERLNALAEEMDTRYAKFKITERLI